MNSAGKVYYDAGALTYAGELSVGGHITTTAVFEELLPKAYEVCKDCPLSFTVTATSAPTIAISEAAGAVLSVHNASLTLTADGHALMVRPEYPRITRGVSASTHRVLHLHPCLPRPAGASSAMRSTGHAFRYRHRARTM